MNWQNPSYLWIELIPGLLLVGWAYSEVRCLRRLRILGDPAVMGITVPWGLRLTALAALLFGISCAAAVVPLPSFHVTTAGAKAPVIEILLDMGSLESSEDDRWETLDASLQVLFDQAPGARFSATALGSSPEVLVYPTFDTQGLRTILTRVRYETAPEAKMELRQAWEKYAAARNMELPPSRPVIVTALPSDDVVRILDAISPASGGIVFAQISNSSGGVKYLSHNASGMPVWTAQPAEIQRFLKSDVAPARSTFSLDPTQWFALAAMLLLSLEYICRILARSRKGRYHVA